MRAKEFTLIVVGVGSWVLLSACTGLPVTLDLSYVPDEGRPLRASGIHTLSYGVAVLDRREPPGSRDLCRRGGAFGGAVRASRDLRVTVANAIAAELLNHDLKVVPVRDSDVTLQVGLLDWVCGVRETEGRRGVSGLIEGEVTVLETSTGRAPLRDLRFEAVRRRSVGAFLWASRYGEVLDDVLGEFSRRVVRHPDVLIAVQAVAVGLRGTASEAPPRPGR